MHHSVQGYSGKGWALGSLVSQAVVPVLFRLATLLRSTTPLITWRRQVMRRSKHHGGWGIITGCDG
jgi:hypothetical protein